MITFIISIIALLSGYAFYAKYLERVMKADPERRTPATTLHDGVDYVPMPWWRYL